MGSTGWTLVGKVVSLLPFFFKFPLHEEVGQRGSCCDLCQSVLPMFSSKSFIVSGLTFRSLKHFELIFENGVKERSSFIFHRTRTNNFTFCMETQKTLNSQNNLEKEEWN